MSKCLDDELYDIYIEEGKQVIESLREIYDKGRADAIDKYSNKLWQVIEKATVNCKLDFTIDDLHNIEIIIKGLAEEFKEQIE